MGEAIKCLAAIPKYRIQATEIAKSEGRLKRDKKAERGMSRDEIKEAEEQVIRGIIADKMDIKGGYAKPHWTDVLWVQLVILPLTVVKILCSLAVAIWYFEGGLWSRGTALRNQEKLGSQSRPVRPVGGGGGGGDVGVGAVAEGQLCSLEGGEGGGEADQDGSEWQV